ncbi:uncharacterized protein CIMG_03534 [Coccidioides immitis RS]|uniref:Uncharacterized protein n=4 Tax=Coccidioides immitis TaxID=5501 RepID=A0A0E1S2U2_COCIM|nr:uncharacterized protein CIMG_03534 [Coccidioides immitis RS]EAS32510.1 hypothetical protein CIMG_03534 [Coccidioides immitis RS]KMP07746.1 hypothetical protein CIRG_07427 [Coccidioides immitis RMSCC 2394]KMU71799.1 hypothetical protein CISG_00109 [Coccidioides immitis RMSCC 3703]KMU82835.1 hypothetical protein CIHG_00618 [Coccidioides immitis H538.4]
MKLTRRQSSFTKSSSWCLRVEANQAPDHQPGPQVPPESQLQCATVVTTTCMICSRAFWPGLCFAALMYWFSASPNAHHFIRKIGQVSRHASISTPSVEVLAPPGGSPKSNELFRIQISSHAESLSSVWNTPLKTTGLGWWMILAFADKQTEIAVLQDKYIYDNIISSMTIVQWTIEQCLLQ